MSNREVAIVAAKRTAIGNFNGTLAGVPASELGSTVIRAALESANINPQDIDEVIMGQILSACVGMNPARQASINAGVPESVPAWMINHVCGSGLSAVGNAYMKIAGGFGNIIIAGGQENMSASPHCINLRVPSKMGSAEMVDTMIRDGLTDVFNNYHMGVTAENIAERFNITRQMQDEFSANSQNKAETAKNSGRFNDEIVPVKVKVKKDEVLFAQDEFIRNGVKAEDLAALRPAFKKDGTVTAGNASGINDGAAAIILMDLKEAQKRGLPILGVIRSFASSGVSPDIMGAGPVPASQKALEKAGWKASDLDLIEANEAFASQAIYVNQQMGWDTNKVNVNGGAIALGHPIGASGARVFVTLLHEMSKRNAKKGLATLCIGGGMGVAMCVEK